MFLIHQKRVTDVFIHQKKKKSLMFFIKKKKSVIDVDSMLIFTIQKQKSLMLLYQKSC